MMLVTGRPNAQSHVRVSIDAVAHVLRVVFPASDVVRSRAVGLRSWGDGITTQIDPEEVLSLFYGLDELGSDRLQ